MGQSIELIFTYTHHFFNSACVSVLRFTLGVLTMSTPQQDKSQFETCFLSLHNGKYNTVSSFTVVAVAHATETFFSKS